MGTTAVTTTDQTEEKGIRALLAHDAARTRIEPFLMPGADYNRVMAGAHYAARQNPQILECTAASIIDAVARIQQWQLEIGTTAHLVPFNVKVSKRDEPDRWAKICTPIADYKGLAELMVRSKAVRHVETRVVYSGDEFSYSYGLDAKLHHVPRMAAKERGVITHAYVVFRLPGGMSSFEVMPIEDIDAIRTKHSKQWKSGPCPAWYAKKTVVRQAAKLVPKDPRFADALRVIQEEEELEFTAGAALPAGGAVAALSPGRAADEEVYETVQENQQRALRNLETVEYLPEQGVASTGRVSREELAEIASRPDPYEAPARVTDPDDPRYADHLPEDDDLFPGTRATGKRNALAEGH